MSGPHLSQPFQRLIQKRVGVRNGFPIPAIRTREPSRGRQFVERPTLQTVHVHHLFLVALPAPPRELIHVLIILFFTLDSFHDVVVQFNYS